MRLHALFLLLLFSSVGTAFAGNSYQEKCSVCHKTAVTPSGIGFHSKHLAKNLNCENCHRVEGTVLLVDRQGKESLKITEDDKDVLIDVFSAEAEKSAAHRHLSSGLQCDSCHQGEIKADAQVKNERCESCHGAQADIAKKTGGKDPKNPHQSHQGKIDCVLCHKGHQTAQSYCISCHPGFEQVMPESKGK